jgi:hypothetical protein
MENNYKYLYDKLLLTNFFLNYKIMGLIPEDGHQMLRVYSTPSNYMNYFLLAKSYMHININMNVLT